MEPSSAAGPRWHLPTLRSVVPFPAAAIPRPTVEHGTGMLHAELAAAAQLLAALAPQDWERRPGHGGLPIRDLVIRLILGSEEVGRNRKVLGPVSRSALPEYAMTDARRRHRTAELATAPPERLITQLRFWGHEAEVAAPGGRRTPARQFRVGTPPGIFADYLFRVLLAREAWLARGDIEEATGRTASPGPHGAEIVRQALRDLADAWAGPPVLVEITGPPAGLWLVGSANADEAVARMRTGAFWLVRQLTRGGDDPPDATARDPAITGDAAAASALLATRIPA
ncbi:MAG TPA: hypothetical protein VMG38_12270 [Trebonia sp.]|nr:hypothetical protein [Trebonia sp.]